MEDDFVVERQGGPGLRLEWRNQIVDRTDRGRLCHRGNRSQHFAVTGPKPGSHLVKEVERVADRGSRFQKNRTLPQCVVAAATDKEMAGIVWKCVQLRGDISGHMAVDGQERGLPPRRK